MTDALSGMHCQGCKLVQARAAWEQLVRAKKSGQLFHFFVAISSHLAIKQTHFLQIET